MSYRDYELEHAAREEMRRLLDEIGKQRMSWSKLGKLIRLNALIGSPYSGPKS